MIKKFIIHNSLFIIPFISIVVLSLIYVIYRLLIPSPVIEHLQAANFTPISVTYTFTTQLPTKACIFALTLPITRTCDLQNIPTTNHYITLNSHQTTLNKTTLIIQSGHRYLITTLDPSFIPDKIPTLPNPAYGQIVYPNINTPAENVTVLIPTKAGLMATLTDQNGRFTLDLNGEYPEKTRLPIILSGNGQYITDYQFEVGAHQPLLTLPLTPAFKSNE